jgi:phospholipid-transporting ATPase
LLNNKKTLVLRGRKWETIKWKNVVVGDVIKIVAGELFPADLLLLSSSEPNSICYIHTSNLDGETNLKVRQGLVCTSNLIDSLSISEWRAEIECEPPNQHLYEFVGNLRLGDEQTQTPIGHEQILLRGSLLQNTKWIHGVVIYTGHETKLMMNSTAPPFKRSQVEKSTNTQILILFIILLVICLISAVASEIWLNKNAYTHWYLGFGELAPSNFAYTFLTFIILYNNLIPISLQVTLELVKFLQAYFINWDEDMYDAENGFSAMARTSNLNEELGMIKYVFSDKTGTLTCNKMEFKRCSVAGVLYGAGNEQQFNGYEILKNLRSHSSGPIIDEFLTLMATCHTVIAEKKEDKTAAANHLLRVDYQASSPDEGALVKAVQALGVVFYSRHQNKISVNFLGDEREYELLNVLEFNSVRKRMSIIVRDKDGSIKLYCKVN